jgi:hypothetical protein
MTYVLFTLAMLVAIYVARWIREGYQPVKHQDLSREVMHRLLDALYFRGFSNGTMTVTVPQYGQLTVCKHIVRDNDVRLRLDIADPALRFTGEAAAVDLRIQPGLSGTPTYWPGSDSMLIDFGNDMRSCEQFVRFVVNQAWHTDLSRESYAELRNVAVGDYRIGWTR